MSQVCWCLWERVGVREQSLLTSFPNCFVVFRQERPNAEWASPQSLTLNPLPDGEGTVSAVCCACHRTPKLTYQTATCFSTLQSSRYRHRHPCRIRCRELCRDTRSHFPGCNSVHLRIARRCRSSTCLLENL